MPAASPRSACPGDRPVDVELLVDAIPPRAGRPTCVVAHAAVALLCEGAVGPLGPGRPGHHHRARRQRRGAGARSTLRDECTLHGPAPTWGAHGFTVHARRHRSAGPARRLAKVLVDRRVGRGRPGRHRLAASGSRGRARRGVVRGPPRRRRRPRPGDRHAGLSGPSCSRGRSARVRLGAATSGHDQVGRRDPPSGIDVRARADDFGRSGADSVSADGKLGAGHDAPGIEPPGERAARPAPPRSAPPSLRTERLTPPHGAGGRAGPELDAFPDSGDQRPVREAVSSRWPWRDLSRPDMAYVDIRSTLPPEQWPVYADATPIRRHRRPSGPSSPSTSSPTATSGIAAPWRRRRAQPGDELIDDPARRRPTSPRPSVRPPPSCVGDAIDPPGHRLGPGAPPAGASGRRDRPACAGPDDEIPLPTPAAADIPGCTRSDRGPPSSPPSMPSPGPPARAPAVRPPASSDAVRADPQGPPPARELERELVSLVEPYWRPGDKDEDGFHGRQARASRVLPPRRAAAAPHRSTAREWVRPTPCR